MDDETRRQKGQESDDLKEAKEIVEGHEVSDSQRFSLDEIMSEYKYNATVTPRSRRKDKKDAKIDNEPLSQDTMTLKALAEEMRAFTQRQQSAPPGPGDGDAPPKAAADVPPAGKPKKQKRGMQLGARDAESTSVFSGLEAEEPEVIVTTQVDITEPDVGPQAKGAGLDEPLRYLDDEDEHIPMMQPEKEETLFLRLRRIARRHEPVAPSIPVEKAAVRLRPYIRFFSVRLIAAGALCAMMVFLTFSHRLPISMPEYLTFLYGRFSYLSILLILQVFVMACGIDVMARGLADLFHVRPGIESAALISCVSNLLYIAYVFFKPDGPTFLPYCAVSALSVLCAMWSCRIRFVANQRTYQTAAETIHPHVVLREETLWEGGAFVKSRGEIEDFVTLTEQPDGAVRFAHFLVPLGVLASFLFALIAAFQAREIRQFFWAFSATMSVVAPFCGAFSYVLPFLHISRRLAHSGAALAGWSAVRSFFEPAVIVLTDGDLFPPGTVALNGLKVFGRFNLERMISYAASLATASGSGLAHAFADLLRGQADAIRAVEHFQHYEGGGMGADIDNDRVLMGNAAFMQRMGVHIPEGIKLPTALFVSVNLDLAGIFAVSYTPINHVRSALSMLARNKITPVFATRDVNLTPAFTGKTYEVALGAAEYPPVEQRLVISDPVRESRARAMAVMGRDGLYPYAESIVAGRRMGQVTRANLVVYLLCVLFGLILMAFLTIQGEAATASPCNVILYLALWMLPTLLVSGWAHRY